jgi:hypothetical protein
MRRVVGHLTMRSGATVRPLPTADLPRRGMPVLDGDEETPVASNLQLLLQPAQWKPRVRERALLLAIISGPLALLMSLIVGVAAITSIARIPAPVDTYAAISNVARVQNYARTALVLWLSGSKTSETPLLARKKSEQDITLSDNGFEVFAVDPVDVVRHQGSDAVEWVVTLSATLVPPGAGGPQVNRYVVTVLEHNGSYQLLTWPIIANGDSDTFTVASKYNVPVERTGPLGQSLSRFVTAYLTSTGAATSLGQYVSSEFTGSAILDSPYSSVEIQEIKAVAGSPQPGTAEPGTQMSVLVRVKAMASVGTWSVMDLPLQVTRGANDVWLVDGVESPVRWGSITGT